MAKPNWITLSQNSGNSGSTTVTITASTYQELVERTGILTITTNNFNLSSSVNITQNPFIPPTLSISPDSILFEGSGGTEYLNIISDSIWNINYPSWVSLSQTSGTGDTVVTINVNRNHTSSVRVGVIKVIDGFNELSCIVVQEKENYVYSKEYLTFNIISDGSIIWKKYGSYNINNLTISYSKDDGSTWTNITSSTAGTPIAVVAGDTVLFKGTNSAYGISGNNPLTAHNCCFSGSTCRFEVEGNIMSLIYGDNFIGNNTLVSANTFNTFFAHCTGLTSIENLVLPSSKLLYGCYAFMFDGCVSLTNSPLIYGVDTDFSCMFAMFRRCVNLITVPSLYTATLSENCYAQMFSGCTSITTTPELPITTLASSCYTQMFAGCTSLATAPTLPATELANSCYDGMFQGCTSLTTAPSLPATTLTPDCYLYMFRGCTSLTTTPELPATILAQSCYNGMFQGCTSLTTAPSLPAAILVKSCYQQMFYSCTSLNYIKCLATDMSAERCTEWWTSSVSSTGTFVKASGSDWSSKTGANGIPSGWTVQDAT